MYTPSLPCLCMYLTLAYYRTINFSFRVCSTNVPHMYHTHTHTYLYNILYIHYRRGIYFNIAPVNDATVHGPFFVINGLSSHTQILESFVLNVGCNFLHPFFFFS